MAVTREDFKRVRETPRRIESVEVPTLGKVFVRQLRIGELDKVQGFYINLKTNDKPIPYEETTARFLVACVCTETGHPLFTAEDIGWIKDLDPEIIGPIDELATKLNRQNKKRQEEVLGNSESGQTSSSA